MNRLQPQRQWLQVCLLGLLLAGATVVAYRPAWNAGFIWDDDVYVTGNSLLTAPDGMKRIWFSTDSPSQYFPLTYTTFRLERSLWGLNPAGYHGFNILLHAVNALLVWRLLRRLHIPGSWLGAAFFALHPVQVESVAWITELKNVQSLFFSLLALLAWVEFLEVPRRWRWYVASLVCFGLALLSKTTACTLPAALLLVVWLQHKPMSRARFGQVAPFVLLALAMGLLSVWWEQHHQGTEGEAFALGIVDRFLIASRAVWFYAGKLVWPANLTFSYPRWAINAADPVAYVWLVAGAAACVLIYRARRFAVGRGLETAAVFYVATLSPTLGFVMLYTFHFSFVADHYQYMAMIGPAALAAAFLRTRGRGKEPETRTSSSGFQVSSLLGGALLLTLGILTWRQCAMYADLETLWRTTLRRNPDSFIAHNSLSAVLLQKGRADEALAHARRALECRPGGPDAALAWINVGAASLQKGQVDEAISHFEKAVALLPDLADAHSDLGSALLRKSRADEAAAHFRKALAIQPGHANANYNLANMLLDRGQLDDAIVHYRKALERNPDDADAHLNAATALAMQERLDEAVIHLNEVLRTQPASAQARNNLAFILLRKGRVREATAQFHAAAELQPDNARTLANLAWVLATSPDASLRDGTKALELARRANQLTGGQDPAVLRSVAAALAEGERFDEASSTVRTALQLLGSQSESGLRSVLEAQLKCYTVNTPFRDPSLAGAGAASPPTPPP